MRSSDGKKNKAGVRRRLKPKDAAALVLVRRDADAPRVLMGRRHAGMAFMANQYVFPGGRVDACDRRLAIGGDLRPSVKERLTRHASEAEARALGLAAIRETFEETGILLGEPSEKLPRTRNSWSRFFGHGIAPKLDALDYIARAITPPGQVRRFDARFFMADAGAIARELGSADSNELLTPAWLTFAEARALSLPSITCAVLDEAEARLREGGASRPAPFFHVRHGRPRIDYLLAPP